MKRKDYIFNMTNLILNRVRFHAPILYSENIDFDSLIKLGVDPSLPIFKFEKTLSRPLFKCFKRAKSVCDFNLILSEENKKAEKELGALVIRNNTEVNKLNINYKSNSGYHLKAEETYVEIDGIRQNLCFHNFYLQTSGISNDVNYFVKEFIMNGRNFYCEYLNRTDTTKTIRFCLNIPLKKGYFIFYNKSKHIEITDLFSGEKYFFNYSCHGSKFIFSGIDGVENSTHACINVTCDIVLKPKQKKVHFFNLGEEQFSLCGQGEIELFMKEADRQINQIFNIRIKSYDKVEQRLLNQTLPEKIYLSWINGNHDKKSEIEYGLLKEKFVVKSKDNYIFSGTYNLQYLQIFNGTYWQKINIERGEGEQYLQINKIKFFNKFSISSKELKNNSNCFILKA